MKSKMKRILLLAALLLFLGGLGSGARAKAADVAANQPAMVAGKSLPGTNIVPAPGDGFFQPLVAWNSRA